VRRAFSAFNPNYGTRKISPEIRHINRDDYNSLDSFTPPK